MLADTPARQNAVSTRSPGADTHFERPNVDWSHRMSLKRLSYALLIVVALAIGLPAASASALETIYRCYNLTNGTHFFTPSSEQRYMVSATCPGFFQYEGVAYSTETTVGTEPLYRFYNRRSASHFYTASADEAAMVLAPWPDVLALEGRTYSVSQAPIADWDPVYRFYNVKAGSHFYTASAQERDVVTAKWSSTYKYDGIAFYVADSGVAPNPFGMI